MANEIGTAYIQILPTTKGIQSALSAQMSAPIAAAGKKAGSELGSTISSTLTSVGGKMQSVGKGLTKHVTAPIAAVGAASIKAFNEVKDGLNIVAQKTGATGKELKAMQDASRNLAKTMPTTFADAGTAIGEVNTRFGVTGKTLESVSAQFIKFAKVNDVDLNNSIDQTQKALAAFGLDVSQAPALLDMMTRAGQQTGVSMEELQSGLFQNGAALQEMGLNINQSVNFMAQLDKSGANSATVMQGLRRALRNAAKDGKPLDQALSDLQNTIKNGKDGTDGLTAAFELFGRSGDQIYGAVKNGSINFEELGASVSNAKGALDAVFNETLTPSEKFQSTMNTLKDTGYELGNSLLTILTPAIEKVAEVAGKISTWWSSLSPQTQDMIVKVALVAAAIGPVITILGKIVSGVGTLMTILPMLASPVGLVVAAIAAVVAIGVALYQNWDKIKEKAGQLKDWVVGKWNELKAGLAAIWEAIKAAGAAAWNAIKTAVMVPVNAIKSGVSAVWNGIKSVTSSVWNGIKNAVTGAANAVRNTLSGVWNKLKSITSTAWNGIKNAITKPIETAKNIIKNIIDKIKGFFNFDFKLPSIKLPHFDIQPEGWELGDLLHGEIPSLGIDWYAKGAIMTKPTLFGGGEAGNEGVIPLDPFWQRLDNMSDSIVGGVATVMAGASGSTGDIVIPIYLYPSGPKMQEEIVKAYDIGKKRLG